METHNVNQRVIITGILILLTVVIGFINHRTGKTSDSFLIAIHKALMVGFIVYTGIMINNLIKSGASGILTYTYFLLSAILIIALIFSGTMLTMKKFTYAMLQIHRYSTLFFLVNISGLFYSIITKKIL